jgi:hypothetical protein
MRQRYICWNGAVPTTGPQVPITLTNAQKTQLQITAASTGQLELVAWGFSFSGESGLQLPVQVELLTTGTVAGTGETAVTPTLYGDPNAPASAATAGFGPTAEGTISAVRMFDSEQCQALGPYFYQFPLGERPIVAVSQVLRVRTNTPSLTTYPGFLCYVVWCE